MRSRLSLWLAVIMLILSTIVSLLVNFLSTSWSPDTTKELLIVGFALIVVVALMICVTYIQERMFDSKQEKNPFSIFISPWSIVIINLLFCIISFVLAPYYFLFTTMTTLFFTSIAFSLRGSKRTVGIDHKEEKEPLRPELIHSITPFQKKRSVKGRRQP